MRLSEHASLVAERPSPDVQNQPVLICLLGSFQALKAGKPVALRPGGKTETLLGHLALQHNHCIPREQLLNLLWPDTDAALAGQALHSVVYSLRKLLGDAISGAMPVIHDGGCYRLNHEGGVSVDVDCFDALVRAGDQQLRAGDLDTAYLSYERAVSLYRGDLCACGDIQTLVERERLRTRYLTLLATLADYHYAARRYEVCLHYAWLLLAHDPCREDAHRLVMDCHVQQGQRAAALRQYRLCVEILRREFDITPERATLQLYEQIRRAASEI